MLKLTFRHKLRILLWRHRRGVIFTLLSLLAAILTVWGNNSLLPAAAPLLTLQILTLLQLAIGSLIVMLVILLCD